MKIEFRCHVKERNIQKSGSLSLLRGRSCEYAASTRGNMEKEAGWIKDRKIKRE